MKTEVMLFIVFKIGKEEMFENTAVTVPSKLQGTFQSKNSRNY